MAVSMIGPKFYAWDRNGKPLSYGKLYTYEAGTTTPKATFPNESGNTGFNTNPVILNGEGYADVYLKGSYKMVLTDSNDNEIWSSDPVSQYTAEEWIDCMSIIPENITTVKVSDNQIDKFEKYRRIRLSTNSGDHDYSSVKSTSFVGGYTLIELFDPIVGGLKTTICRSVVGVESAPFIPGITVSTEQLLSDNSVFGDVIDTIEYYTGSGYGGATWVKTGNTGTAGTTDFDNGLLYDANGNEYKIIAEKINPYMFGAYGDYDPDTRTGNDDTDAIKSCINYTFEGVMYLLQGNYLCSDNIIFEDNIVIGDGAEKTSLYMESCTGFAVEIGLPYAGGTYINRTAKGFSINSTIDALGVSTCEDGLHIRNIFQNKGDISDITINCFNNTNRTGLSMSNIQDCNIENVKIEDCYDGLNISVIEDGSFNTNTIFTNLVVQKCANKYITGGLKTQNITFIGGVCQGPDLKGMHLTDAQQIGVIGMYFESSTAIHENINCTNTKIKLDNVHFSTIGANADFTDCDVTIISTRFEPKSTFPNGAKCTLNGTTTATIINSSPQLTVNSGSTANLIGFDTSKNTYSGSGTINVLEEKSVDGVIAPIKTFVNNSFAVNENISFNLNLTGSSRGMCGNWLLNVGDYYSSTGIGRSAQYMLTITKNFSAPYWVATITEIINVNTFPALVVTENTNDSGEFDLTISHSGDGVQFSAVKYGSATPGITINTEVIS